MDIPFITLACGGLILETLSTKNDASTKKQNLYCHYYYYSRALSLTVLCVGLISSALFASIDILSPFKDTTIIILSILLFVSGALYLQSKFSDSRYWLMSDTAQNFVKPWRILIIDEILNRECRAMTPEEIHELVPEIIEKNIKYSGPLKKVSCDAIFELCFPSYLIKESFKEMNKDQKYSTVTIDGKEYLKKIIS